MAKAEFVKKGYIKNETFIIFVIIFTIVGFLGGVYSSRDIEVPEDHKHVKENVNNTTSGKIAEFKKRVSQNPKDTKALHQLGNLYYDDGQFKKAINTYQKYLEIDSTNPAVITDMGVMYRRIGDSKKAVETFSKAIEVDPKFEAARFNKGIVLMHDLNDMKNAIKTWEELVAINPFALTPNGESVDMIVQKMKTVVYSKQ